MNLEIDDAEVDALVDQLAERKGVSKNNAVREALRNELDRMESAQTRIAEVMEMIRVFNERHPPTGLTADKAFIDSLYED